MWCVNINAARNHIGVLNTRASQNFQNYLPHSGLQSEWSGALLVAVFKSCEKSVRNILVHLVSKILCTTLTLSSGCYLALFTVLQFHFLLSHDFFKERNYF